MKSVIATVIFSTVMAVYSYPDSYDDLVKKNMIEAKDIHCPAWTSDEIEAKVKNCLKAAEGCVAAYGNATTECKIADQKVNNEAQAKMEKCFKTNVEKRAACGKAAYDGASTLIMGASAIAMAAALF